MIAIANSLEGNGRLPSILNRGFRFRSYGDAHNRPWAKWDAKEVNQMEVVLHFYDSYKRYMKKRADGTHTDYAANNPEFAELLGQVRKWQAAM